MWLEPHHADCLIRSVGPIDRFILTAKLHENGWLHSENASGNISPLRTLKNYLPRFFSGPISAKEFSGIRENKGL